MQITVKELKSHTPAWDRYVAKNEAATVYHLSGWSNIFEKTYGYKTYLLAAVKNNTDTVSNKVDHDQIVGILPITKHRSITLSSSLVSMPFVDIGGAIADNEEIKQELVNKAISIGRKIGTKEIELRQKECKKNSLNINVTTGKKSLHFREESKRFRLLLDLPGTSKELMGSFKSKLRSQIRKPLKSGCVAEVGKAELLEDFYKVFVSNMRDLGSPVHSKRLFENLFDEFNDLVSVFIVRYKKRPIAGSITLGYQGTMYNPWASSLQQFRKYSPNMLLYWKMLELCV